MSANLSGVDLQKGYCFLERILGMQLNKGKEKEEEKPVNPHDVAELQYFALHD